MKGSLCRPAETSFLWRDTVTKTRERFNPRAPCGARPAEVGEPLGDFAISIHAPLAGRDVRFDERRDQLEEFQPTRPLRGATVECRRVAKSWYYFNPRAPCGARPVAPLRTAGRAAKFQPTRPLRARRKSTINRNRIINFNPRAPYGRDRLCSPWSLGWRYFNPRAPYGRDQIAFLIHVTVVIFQPPRPLRARQQKCTNHYAHFCDNRQISDAFAQNAACQGILFLFCARKTCKF